MPAAHPQRRRFQKALALAGPTQYFLSGDFNSQFDQAVGRPQYIPERSRAGRKGIPLFVKNQILLNQGNCLDLVTGVMRKNIAVHIRDDTITAVEDAGQAAGEETTTIDCTGKYLLPGLFECHTHLTILTNQADEVKAAILDECGLKKGAEAIELEKEVLKEFVNRGITQIRDVGGPVSTLKRLKDDISNGKYLGPELFYAGPMLEKSPLTGEANNARWPGFSVAVDSRRDVKKVLRRLSTDGVGLIKTFGKFDHEALKSLVAEAKKMNLPTTHDVGSTFFHAVPMDVGRELGINCFEHGKSPWYVVLKDELKAEHDSLRQASPEKKEAFIAKAMALKVESISQEKLKRLAQQMVEEEIYFCPTLHIFKHQIDHPEIYHDADHEKFRKIFAALYDVSCFITRRFVREGVRMMVGQDGWNPAFTANEMELLVEMGLSEMEVIRGATTYPAQWLGVTNQLGVIAPGRRANIVILDKNPLEDIRNIRTVRLVLKDGRVAYQA